MKQPDQKFARLARRAQASMTLGDVMVGLVLCALLMAMTSSLWLYGIRNFGAMANNPEREAKSGNNE